MRHTRRRTVSFTRLVTVFYQRTAAVRRSPHWNILRWAGLVSPGITPMRRPVRGSATETLSGKPIPLRNRPAQARQRRRHAASEEPRHLNAEVTRHGVTRMRQRRSSPPPTALSYPARTGSIAGARAHEVDPSNPRRSGSAPSSAFSLPASAPEACHLGKKENGRKGNRWSEAKRDP